MENYVLYISFGGCIQLPLQKSTYSNQNSLPFCNTTLLLTSVYKFFTYIEGKQSPSFCLNTIYLIIEKGFPHGSILPPFLFRPCISWINGSASLLWLHCVIYSHVSPVTVKWRLLYKQECVLYWNCYSRAFLLLEELFNSSNFPQNPTLNCITTTD